MKKILLIILATGLLLASCISLPTISAAGSGAIASQNNVEILGEIRESYSYWTFAYTLDAFKDLSEKAKIQFGDDAIIEIISTSFSGPLFVPFFALTTVTARVVKIQ